MKSAIKILILGVIFGNFCFVAFADTLYLKKGEKLEGRVVGETQEKITFEIEGGRVDFYRSEIKSIEKDGEKRFEVEASMKSTAVGGSIPAAAASVKKDASGAAVPIKAAVQTVNASRPQSTSRDWKKEMTSWASRMKESALKGSRNGKKTWTDIGFIILGSALQMLVAGAVMKGYFSLSREHVTYFHMVWFQVKLGVIGFIIGFVIGACAVLITGNKAGGGIALRYLLLFLLLYTIAYYVLAKKDLEIGFGEALLLSVIIGITYFGVAKGMTAAGFAFPTNLDLMLGTFPATRWGR